MRENMLHPRNPTLDFCRMPMPALCVRFTPASDLNDSRCRPKSAYSMHGGPGSYFSYTCAAVPGTNTSPIGETIHLLDHAMDSFLDPNGNQPAFFRTTADRSRPSSLLQTAWQRTGSLLSVCSLNDTAFRASKGYEGGLQLLAVSCLVVKRILFQSSVEEVASMTQESLSGLF